MTKKMNKQKIDNIQRKRDTKRWKLSFGYYCLNSNKFNFGLKNLE